jgi:hypothetical protein
MWVGPEVTYGRQGPTAELAQEPRTLGAQLVSLGDTGIGQEALWSRPMDGAWETQNTEARLDGRWSLGRTRSGRRRQQGRRPR